MRTLISLYLLLKSGTGQKLTWFDVRLAKVLTGTWWGSVVIVDDNAPIWLAKIANLKQEVPLPEAFDEWWITLGNTLADLIWGKS